MNSWAQKQTCYGTDSSPKSLATAKQEKSRSDGVRDDWEDDDDEEHDNPPVEERNKRIWDQANARESRPMPSVVISRGLSCHIAPSSLPLNEPPTMRILKRPSPSTNIPTNINTMIGESLQDREARYMAARERIFGTTSPTAEDEPTEELKEPHHYGKERVVPSSSTPLSQVVRELRGLGDGPNGSSNKGFLNTPGPSKAQ